jgi:hypothetical protein
VASGKGVSRDADLELAKGKTLEALGGTETTRPPSARSSTCAAQREPAELTLF